MSSVDIHNLTDKQKTKAIADLRAALGPGNEKHDDRELLRFLVARSLDIPATTQMFQNYLKWRQESPIANPPLPTVDGNPLQTCVRGFQTVPDGDWDINHPLTPEKFKKFYPNMGGGCFHKFAKDGMPVFIERTGLHDVKGLAVNCSEETMIDWHVRNQEFIFEILMKEASQRSGKVIEKHYVIFDCTGLGFHQFSMTGIQLLRAISTHDSLYYPERLQKLFIVNTPGLFARAWGIIKPWLDKGTLEKIVILGSSREDVTKSLLEYVDKDSLPEFLGGSCTCSHMPGGCVPSPYLEEKAKAKKK
ncbi:cytosolic factor, phosphatidylinositol/phosphatidylcholine transfer protein [Rhizophlyctis rosea]|uniref:Cytosolic factor, phosphatidylinositol/phosphatidylcholine transfer protein n=1 Tax=Rhizophlyctis rosea TaxID=64517 RepID=A0AAD5SJA0_9FUNG|nr:cytosolic factor, phosphatidylinositol/phosphatidylcholine transfer protein [Rhizophlyctis rosea]